MAFFNGLCAVQGCTAIFDTGRVYNADNMPSYGLPANKTRMTIKSKTHKGMGSNEMRFDDARGKEEIYIHAQKDQNNIVENDETTHVKHDRSETVGNNEIIAIGVDRSETGYRRNIWRALWWI